MHPDSWHQLPLFLILSVPCFPSFFLFSLPSFLSSFLSFSLIKEADGCPGRRTSEPYGNQSKVTRIERPFLVPIVTAPASCNPPKARYLVWRLMPNSRSLLLDRATVLLRRMRHSR